jgi:PP-loop superfamily ATP-utilizing enzyme
MIDTTGIADRLAGIGRLGVAYSGGVDSSVLLALAARALGHHRVVACTGRLPDELQAARNPTSTERRDAVA